MLDHFWTVCKIDRNCFSDIFKSIKKWNSKRICKNGIFVVKFFWAKRKITLFVLHFMLCKILFALTISAIVDWKIKILPFAFSFLFLCLNIDSSRLHSSLFEIQFHFLRDVATQSLGFLTVIKKKTVTSASKDDF